MKKAMTIVLVVCIIAMLCGCEKDPAKVEGSGFDSAEKAVLAYAEALKTGDVSAVLSTFAVETYVENYDMEEYLEYIRCYMYAGPTAIDSADTYTRDLNLINRQYQISKNLTNMYLTVGKLENFTVPIPFNGDPYGDASDLMDDLVIDDWMEMLAEMEIGDVLEAEDFSDLGGIDGLEDALDRQADYFNCDELVSLAVEVEIDGEDYYLCVDVACYDGTWYNCTPMGMLSMLMGAEALCGGLVSQDS